MHRNKSTSELVLLFLHTFMCSPVEGPRKTETLHFFNKIVGIKVSCAYFLTICVSISIYIYIAQSS